MGKHTACRKVYNMRIEELKQLCMEHPVSIPVRTAAKFLGMSEEGLRASMEQNRCPFGLCWCSGTRLGYKINTDAFFNWITKGTIPGSNPVHREVYYGKKAF